jgi:hypothetical protein
LGLSGHVTTEKNWWTMGLVGFSKVCRLSSRFQRWAEEVDGLLRGPIGLWSLVWRP